MVLSHKSDLLGAFASGLCLVHCLVTPFLFVAQACMSSCCEATPVWWQAIDYFFLAISVYMVYWSAKASSKTWMKYALWLSWFALFFAMLNNKLDLLHLPENAAYLPAMGLVVLHAFNNKFYRCCAENGCQNS